MQRLFVTIVSICLPCTLQAFDWQATWSNTWGYTMLSKEEIGQFERDIRALRTLEECEAVLKKHNIIIQQRIDDWVITPKRSKPVDTCGLLKSQGLLPK